MEYSAVNMGEIIRDMRKSKTLPQDALAQATGVSVQAVSKWENGQSLPDVMLLPSIADFFGISIDTLFGRESAAPHPAESPAAAPFPDDGRLRVAQYMGSRLMSADECVDGKAISLSLEKCEGVLKVEVRGSARVNGSVSGGLSTQGDAYISGDVHGAVNVAGSFQCEGNVNGATVNADASTLFSGFKGDALFSGLRSGLSELSSAFSNAFNKTKNGKMDAKARTFFSGQLPDDEIIRVVQMQGCRLLSADECPDDRVIRLSVEHITDPLNVEIYGHAEIRGSVNGKVDAGTSVTCGNVEGSVDAGTSVSCGNVNGKVNAGTNMSCGSVSGNVSAGVNVRVEGDVGGKVDAGVRATYSGNSSKSEAGNVRVRVKTDSVHVNIPDDGINVSVEPTGEQSTPDFSDLSSQPGVLNVVQVMDGRILSADESRGDQAIRLCLEDAGNLAVHIQGDAQIEGGVSGNVSAAGSITCDGYVEGNVQAGGNVECDLVEGSVTAGCDVNCDSVEGDVNAGGNVSCGDVAGDVTAKQGNVDCDSVEGDVNAGASVQCDDVAGDVTAKQGDVDCDSVEGDVNAGGNVNCDSVGGDVRAIGAFHCEGDIEGGVYRK